MSGEGVWGECFKTYWSLCQVRASGVRASGESFTTYWSLCQVRASGERVLKHTGLCVR